MNALEQKRSRERDIIAKGATETEAIDAAIKAQKEGKS